MTVFAQAPMQYLHPNGIPHAQEAHSQLQGGVLQQPGIPLHQQLSAVGALTWQAGRRLTSRSGKLSFSSRMDRCTRPSELNASSAVGVFRCSGVCGAQLRLQIVRRELTSLKSRLKGSKA